MNTEEISKRLERLQGKKTLLLENRKRLRSELEQSEKDLENYTKARWVLTEVAKLTQERFKAKVETLVTMVIQSVFDRPFKFSLEFTRERNRFVCTPKVMEGDYEYIPKDDMGGGIIDLISFALRIVLWSVERPASRNTFVLDEPMKFVGKGELLMKAGKMIREISHKMNCQIIMVTHEPELSAIADAAWKVEHRSGKSVVTNILADIPKKKMIRRRQK